jgi:hypothetical protein
MLSYISNKGTSQREKVLLVKNKKHTNLCGARKCKNIFAETDYRFQKYTA